MTHSCPTRRPSDREEKDEEDVGCHQPPANEPGAGVAYKIATDPHRGKLIYVRVDAGKLEAGSTVLNSVNGRKERIGKVYQMHANKREEIASVGAGQIVAVMGLKDNKTGQTIDRKSTRLNSSH